MACCFELDVNLQFSLISFMLIKSIFSSEITIFSGSLFKTLLFTMSHSKIKKRKKSFQDEEQNNEKINRLDFLFFNLIAISSSISTRNLSQKPRIT